MLLSNCLAPLAVVPATLAALATTTQYNDGSKGACGCGNTSGAFPWQHQIAPGVYTAAGSPGLFDPINGSKGWCGAGCGTCYSLTNQGYAPPGQGTGDGRNQSVIVMLTNLCPYKGNERWCPPKGKKNQYGYDAHFDIMGGSFLNWHNPVVSYKQVPCPQAAQADYKQCYCASHAS